MVVGGGLRLGGGGGGTFAHRAHALHSVCTTGNAGPDVHPHSARGTSACYRVWAEGALARGALFRGRGGGGGRGWKSRNLEPPIWVHQKCARLCRGILRSSTCHCLPSWHTHSPCARAVDSTGAMTPPPPPVSDECLVQRTTSVRTVFLGGGRIIEVPGFGTELIAYRTARPTNTLVRTVFSEDFIVRWTGGGGAPEAPGDHNKPPREK